MCSSYAFRRLAQFAKMAANGSEKAFCVLPFHECRSVTIVQRQFRTKFGKQPPSDNSIGRWYAEFQETGCVCKRKSTGRPSVTEENELDYRVDVCRITKGAHIEHL